MDLANRKSLADRAMDKAMKKLIPFIVLMYVVAFLDRANIGFAKQAFQLDTGLSNEAYALGAGIFFLGYAVFEVPSNIMMHRTGARIWLGRIMITWGIVAAAFSLATTERSFLILRVLLGICEAGFFPGIIYYLTFWFTSRRRSTINGLFYMGAPISMIFGSPLSGLLLDMNGVLGFKGWQWLFIVEGLLAVLVGIWALWYLIDKPEKAKFLQEDEKQALIAELNAENSEKVKEKGSVLSALANPKVIYLCLIYFTIQLGVYGVTFYLPSQVSGLLGVKVGTMVGIVSAIPWVCAMVATLTIPKYSDRSGLRGQLAGVLMLIGAIGLIISTTTSPVIGIIGLSLALAGYVAVQPIFWTIPPTFLSGVAAAGAIALINSIGNLGGFVAPNLRVLAEQVIKIPNAGMYSIAGIVLIGAVMLFLSSSLGIGTWREKTGDTNVS